MHSFLDSQQCRKLQASVWLCPDIIVPHLRSAADVLGLGDATVITNVTSIQKLSDTGRE